MTVVGIQEIKESSCDGRIPRGEEARRGAVPGSDKMRGDVK